MKNQLLSLAGALLLSVTGVHAQKPAVVLSDKTGWHKITETKVNFDKETDEVEVLLADKFAALKFKVKDAPIELRELMVYFEDGSDQKITIGKHMKKAGEDSPVIQLKGMEEKSIQRIVLSYNTVKGHQGKKAHMEIWGKKTNADEKQKVESEKKEHHDHKKVDK